MGELADAGRHDPGLGQTDHLLGAQHGELGAAAAQLVVADELGFPGADGIGGEDGVGVDADEEVAVLPGQGPGLVEGARLLAGVGDRLEDDQCRARLGLAALCDLDGAVGAVVGGDDDVVDRPFLGEDGVERGADALFFVVRRDEHGQARTRRVLGY